MQNSEDLMTKYLIDPLAPFHARWRDKVGPIRVLSGPVKGYLMCARPNCRPFVLRVSEILNADKPPNGMGPFEPIGANLSTAADQ
jgi:hypothetical protein